MTKSILVIADEHENLTIEKAHIIAYSLDARLDVVRFLCELDTED